MSPRGPSEAVTFTLRHKGWESALYTKNTSKSILGRENRMNEDYVIQKRKKKNLSGSKE